MYMHLILNIVLQFSENANFNDTLSEKSSCTTQDTMSTQDSKLESVLEGFYNHYYYNLLLTII